MRFARVVYLYIYCTPSMLCRVLYVQQPRVNRRIRITVLFTDVNLTRRRRVLHAAQYPSRLPRAAVSVVQKTEKKFRKIRARLGRAENSDLNKYPSANNLKLNYLQLKLCKTCTIPIEIVDYNTQQGTVRFPIGGLNFFFLNTSKDIEQTVSWKYF